MEGVELFENTYKLEWMRDPWADVEAAGKWLAQLEAHFRPQLVHLNAFAYGANAWQAPVLMVAHSCLLSWWDAVKRTPPPPEYQEYRRRVTMGLAGADLVVAPSAALLAGLEKHYGKLTATLVIPNGRSIGVVGPAPKKEPLVFTAGRLWDEGKNVMALDTVAHKLAWPVYAAGDTSHPDSGAVAPAHLQLLGRLHPRTIAGWFSRAAVYAEPARYEPFGLTALEAGLAGCALVLGDIPSLREVWQDAAVYVPPDDTAALERALIRLIRDERQRRDMATRAHTRAQMFTGCRMLASYSQAYRDLLNPKQARAATVVHAEAGPAAESGSFGSAGSSMSAH